MAATQFLYIYMSYGNISAYFHVVKSSVETNLTTVSEMWYFKVAAHTPSGDSQLAPNFSGL